MGVVASLNVGQVRAVEWAGRQVTTAIFKVPVSGRVAIRGVNLEGDDQADRSVHGGPDKAIYSYAAEDYAWWRGELGRELSPGQFGENLTLSGVELTGALIGERWRAGSAVLQVAQPRFPCFKLGLKMGDAKFVKRFAQALRPGAYLRILEEGLVGAGDEVEVISTPSHGWTIQEVARIILFRSEELHRLAEVPELAESLVELGIEHGGSRPA